MIYAQFYDQSCIDGGPIEACGDRAVIILDGRNSSATWHEIAARECIKRGYIGWRIYRGVSFTRAVAISNVSFPAYHPAEYATYKIA